MYPTEKCTIGCVRI